MAEKSESAESQYQQKLDELRTIVGTEIRTALTEMAQTVPSPDSLTRELVQGWVIEAVAVAMGEQAPDDSAAELFGSHNHDAEHHICADDDCEPCRTRDTELRQEGAAESSAYYEQIPGVTNCREKWTEAIQVLHIS